MSSVILSDNRFLDGLPTTQYTAAGYSVLNIRDGRTYTSWRSDRAGAQYVTVDCGTPKGADTLGLAGTNFKGLSGTYVAVESSDNGIVWTSRRSSVELPYSTGNRAYLKTFLGATARWWRVMVQTVYQFALEGLLLSAILWLYSRKPRPAGTVGSLFLIAYGVLRMIGEVFREPEALYGHMPLGLSAGQWLSVPMVILGIAFFVHYSRAPASPAANRR